MSRGKFLGKLVTVYAHIELNEADGLLLEGKLVQKGELLSNHLYSGTMGGPHLHFEVRISDRAINPRHFLETAPDVLKEVRSRRAERVPVAAARK